MTHASGSVTLVLGGARSGKSRYAETICRQTDHALIYVATAEAHDDEMKARIAQHRAERAEDGWQTIEEPRDLASILKRQSGSGRVLLVDCLTLWLTNHLLADADIEAEIEKLCASISASSVDLVLVANEVGFGIVPENKLARIFRDHAGRLNQRIAVIADRVTLVVAGIPVEVK